MSKPNPVGPRTYDPVPPKDSGKRELTNAPHSPQTNTDANAFHLTPALTGQTNGWLEGGQAILDPTGHITEINETLSIWLGRPASALTGCRFWELLVERCAEWRECLDAFCRDTSTFSQ